METAKAKLLHYVVDARASRFTVQAFASWDLSAMGHNPKIGIRTFAGEVDFSPEAPREADFACHEGQFAGRARMTSATRTAAK